jgi:RNA polymerase sigma-70 factor (ECF subfamily)
MTSSARREITASEFEPHRARLKGLAYRMLGSLAEAEDVVQDAFLRVREVDRDTVVDVLGYLHTTVARLCLDRLKSARARRELYVGTWLPEPIVDEPAPQPDNALDRAQDLSFALLMTLERLTPAERTAFLLHDVFGRSFDEVAQVLQRTAAACRKLAERARSEIHGQGPRVATPPAAEQRLTQAFMLAASTGDIEGLKQLLASDAVLYTDGGGKRRAAHNPIYGPERIGRFFAGILARSDYRAPERVDPRRINQLPGYVLTYSDGDLVVSALEIEGDKVKHIYVISNPDKLAHLRS